MRGNDWVADLVRDMWPFIEDADLPHLRAAVAARGIAPLDLGAKGVVGGVAKTGLNRPMLRLVKGGRTTLPCH